MRAVKVPPNSASLEEARHRVFNFFKQACRSIPTVMEIYNLDDVVTPSQLRSTISKEIRKNQSITNPKVLGHMRAPIYVYYELENFYQNHRRYVKSRSDKQLRFGAEYTAESCSPVQCDEIIVSQLFPAA